MKRYSFFHSLIMCFGSSNFYIDVKENRKGTGFLNLFSTTILVNIIAFLIINSSISDLNKPENIKKAKDSISNFLDKDGLFDAKEQVNRAFDILNQIPDITIENNILSSTEKMPVDIVDPQTETELMKIDLSESIASLKGTGYLSYLTKDRLITKGNSKKSGEDERILYIDNLEAKDEKILNGYLYYLSKLPKLSIKNNLASIDRESPYIIYNPNRRNKPDIVFDMSDNADENSLLYKESYVIFTKSKIFFPQYNSNEENPKNNEFIGETIQIKNINNENMLKAIDILMPEFIMIIKENILPSLLLFGIVFYYGASLLLALSTSLIGILISKYLRYSIEYDEVLRLSSYAILPFIITYPIFLILSFTHSELIFLPPNILFITCLGYITLAILVNKNNTKQTNIK